MQVNGFVVHGAVAAAVFASGVGAVIADTTASGGVTLAGPQVLRLIQNAPTALAAYPSVKMTLSMSLSGNGQHATIDEHGVVTPDGKGGRVQLDLPDGAPSITFLDVGETMYVPASQQSVATLGKHWIGLHLTRTGNAGTLTSPSGSDAMTYLRLMPGATGEVKVLGHPTVDGVRTTHYRVTVDVLKAYQHLPPELQSSSGSQLQQLGVTTIPVDVWLDAQHALRQEKLSISTHGLRVDLTIRLAGSTTPVNVVAPTPSDVYFVTTIRELAQDAINH